MSKIKKRLKEIKLHYNNFGLKYSISYFSSCLFKRKKYKTRRLAINILEKKFKYIFEKYSEKTYVLPAIFEKNIFIYWAQGEKNMPFIPQESLRRIRKLYSDFSIHVIDDSNISEYVELDSRILELYKKKLITIQTFSDILRFNLLYKYGGFWIDSTIMFFEKLPLDELVKKCGFYSLNNNSFEKEKLWKKVYDVTYTTFFLGTHKGNYCMAACVEFYNDYYKNYNYAIDYFMNDYMLILCMKYSICNGQLRKIPLITGSPFDLINYIKGANVDLKNVKNCPQKMDWRIKEIENVKKVLKMIDSGDFSDSIKKNN